MGVAARGNPAVAAQPTIFFFHVRGNNLRAAVLRYVLQRRAERIDRVEPSVPATQGRDVFKAGRLAIAQLP